MVELNTLASSSTCFKLFLIVLKVIQQNHPLTQHKEFREKSPELEPRTTTQIQKVQIIIYYKRIESEKIKLCHKLKLF